MNSIVTAKFDKCGKNKHDVFSRKVSNAQEQVRGTLKAEFMKWIFRFAIIKLRPRANVESKSRRIHLK